MTNIFKTIFTDIGNIFKKLFGTEPKLAQTVTATIAVCAPLVETIVVLTASEADAVAVQNVVEQVQADFTAITALVQTSGPTPTLLGVLNAVQVNLGQLLTAGDIKDPVTLAKVTTVVDSVIQEIAAIVTLVQDEMPVTAAPAPAPVATA